MPMTVYVELRDGKNAVEDVELEFDSDAEAQDFFDDLTADEEGGEEGEEEPEEAEK